MYLLIFLGIGVTGILLQRSLINEIKGIYKISIIWILGAYVTISLLYFTTILIPLSFAIGIYGVALFVICIVRKPFNNAMLKSLISLNTLWYLLGVTFFNLLFSRSFSYDPNTHTFLIASNTYQDFGAHISFIRSFSLGANVPFEVPFYASSGLMYHFIFYYFAGVLELFGMRVDVALNLISAISFFSLLVIVVAVAKKIFKSTSVGLIACILILFNSSLSAINFFRTHTWDFYLPLSIWRNSLYQVQPLFLGEKVDVFWNLNTYLNQRHFIFGSLYFMFIFLQLINITTDKNYEKKKIWILAVLTGMLVFWHALAFLAILLLLLSFIILFANVRKLLTQFFLVTLITASPFILLIKIHSSNSIAFHIGFLSSKVDVIHILTYWIINLGFLLIPLLLVFPFLNSFQKRIYIAVMVLFITPNIINFSTRFLYDNHKFFNIWIVCVSVFAAYFIHSIYKKNMTMKLGITVLMVLCITSGIIDIFVIKNDVFARIPDFKYSKSYEWIIKNTDKDSVFVTNGEIYDPLSLIGRKTYLGREFYIYVYGGNPENRIEVTNRLLQGKSTDRVSIDYIVVYKSNDIKNKKDVNIPKLNQEHKKIYEDNQTIIYKI